MNELGPIYNTVMSVAAGLGLLLIVAFGYLLQRGRTLHRQAWAAAFAALGVVLAFTGGHMTVTHPLQGAVAFDNIIFGEPSLAMGVLLLFGAFLLGSRRLWPAGEPGMDATDPGASTGVPPGAALTSRSWPRLATLLAPLSWFSFAMGLSLIAIAFIGPFFSPWTAPPIEPISGEFADTPWVENAFITAIYALTAIGALLVPFALLRPTLASARGIASAIAVCWAISGAALLVFGALNYYTHSGLLINQSEAAQQEGGG